MKHDKPNSDSELAEMLRLAYEHAQRDEFDTAYEICDLLIRSDATAVAGYRQRAAVRSLEGEISEAIVDMRALLERCDAEPADHHAIGLLLLERGANQEAVDMFSRAVELGEAAGFSYYTESARLLGAAAHARLGDDADARRILLLVPDGAEAYAFGSGLLSKESILATLDRAPPRPSL